MKSSQFGRHTLNLKKWEWVSSGSQLDLHWSNHVTFLPLHVSLSNTPFLFVCVFKLHRFSHLSLCLSMPLLPCVSVAACRPSPPPQHPPAGSDKGVQDICSPLPIISMLSHLGKWGSSEPWCQTRCSAAAINISNMSYVTNTIWRSGVRKKEDSTSAVVCSSFVHDHMKRAFITLLITWLNRRHLRCIVDNVGTSFWQERGIMTVIQMKFCSAALILTLILNCEFCYSNAQTRGMSNLIAVTYNGYLQAK